MLAASPISSVLFWVVVAIVLVLIGAIGIFALRRSILGEPKGVEAGEAGLMEQMRRMVERGEMTQAEYDQARRAMVERARRGGQAGGEGRGGVGPAGSDAGGAGGSGVGGGAR
jgi:uncharacterized membrane protein YgcG